MTGRKAEKCSQFEFFQQARLLPTGLERDVAKRAVSFNQLKPLELSSLFLDVDILEQSTPVWTIKELVKYRES